MLISLLTNFWIFLYIYKCLSIWNINIKSGDIENIRPVFETFGNAGFVRTNDFDERQNKVKGKTKGIMPITTKPKINFMKMYEGVN